MILMMQGMGAKVANNVSSSIDFGRSLGGVPHIYIIYTYLYLRKKALVSGMCISRASRVFITRGQGLPGGIARGGAESSLWCRAELERQAICRR